MDNLKPGDLCKFNTSPYSNLEGRQDLERFIGIILDNYDHGWVKIHWNDTVTTRPFREEEHSNNLTLVQRA